MKGDQVKTLLCNGLNMKPALLSIGSAAEITRLLSTPLASADQPDDEEGVPGHIELCAASFGLPDFDDRKPFAFYDGIAYIPVYGILINRFNWCYSWLTGYQFIRSQFDMAMDDPDVKGVVFDINSYGGVVYGNFELCRHIVSRRDEKPVIAMVDAVAFSGGYSIASACGSIVLTPSGDAGSIGVVMMHVDMSKALAEFGYKVTLIYSGDHKVDGNPYEALPKEVQADMQAGCEKSRKEFVALVAFNRGLEEQAVRDTEARIYDADEALQIGLIDAIAPPNVALASFRSELTGSTNSQWRQPKMSTNTPVAEPTAAPAAAAPAAEPTAAAPAAAPAAAAPAATAVTTPEQAAVAERERVAGILGCEEAAGREAQASHFALKTSMSVADARAALATAPKAAPAAAAAGNGFERAMEATGNPNISGTDGGTVGAGADAEQTPAKVGARIVASYNAAHGITAKTH